MAGIVCASTWAMVRVSVVRYLKNNIFIFFPKFSGGIFDVFDVSEKVSFCIFEKKIFTPYLNRKSRWVRHGRHIYTFEIERRQGQ